MQCNCLCPSVRVILFRVGCFSSTKGKKSILDFGSREIYDVGHLKCVMEIFSKISKHIIHTCVNKHTNLQGTNTDTKDKGALEQFRQVWTIPMTLSIYPKLFSIISIVIVLKSAKNDRSHACINNHQS